MDEVDNMLQDLGISTPSDNQSEQSSTFSDEDVNDILEENGFGDSTFEEEDNEAPAIGTIIDSEFGEEPMEEEDQESSSEEEESAEETTAQEPVKLSLNSPTLLLDEGTSRFSGAEWFNEIQKQRIIIAGQGGIGSNLTFQIARMTPANITIYDDDIVEGVNMAGQLYSYSDIGRAKVNAIADFVKLYTVARQVNAIREKFTKYTEPGDIMMCGFDNMKARKTFFDSWVNHTMNISEEERKKCLFLDGRLSMTTLQVFCMRGDDWYNINRYNKEFLFSDSEADETVCSMKQTTYLACMIGSLMTNLFTNFVANSLDPIIPYDLPFFTEYDAQTMIFKTEN